MRGKTKKGDSKLDYTSITGSECKKLLDKLPAKLRESGTSECENVARLWESFNLLYKVMNNSHPSNVLIRYFHENSLQWVKDFLLVGNKVEGYTKACITPYMHVMVYHIPYFLKRFGSIKQFTGQGVEKSNDDIKIVYFRKSNKHDATAQALKVRFRKALLYKCRKVKRKYRKINTQYWQHGRQLSFQRYRQRFISQYDNET